MITFLLGVIIGICIGVGGTSLFFIYRARTFIKRMLKQVQEKGGDPLEN